MNGPVRLAELRAGSTRDLNSINAIMGEAFDPRFGEAWTPSQCIGMLSLPGVWLTVAAVDGQDAGFALARSTLDDGELLLLATRPALRGRGVGSALLRSIVAEARNRNVRKLHLEVRAGNAAVQLYLREGFAKIGDRRDYYRGKDGRQYDAQTFLYLLD